MTSRQAAAAALGALIGLLLLRLVYSDTTDHYSDTHQQWKGASAGGLAQHRPWTPSRSKEARLSWGLGRRALQGDSPAALWLRRLQQQTDGGGSNGAATTNATQDDIRSSGWRAAWVDGFDMGKGFHRETGQLAATGITFTPQQEEPLVNAPRSSYAMLSTSSDYSKVVTAGGSASFEGWGASASASFKSLSSLQLSTKDLTAMASMVYLSDPVTVINPAVSTLEVKLDPSAEELLRSQGPVAFHEEFGSHFISGYTKGGAFVGAYVMHFTDAQSAQENSASISASYSGWGFSASGSADFESKVKQSQGFESVTASYDCYGWSAEFPPEPATTLDKLVDGISKFSMNDGRRMEAVLKRYEDLDTYRAARDDYKKQNPDAQDYQYILEENYGELRGRLNSEYMRYQFMVMMLQEETDQAFKEVVDTANSIMRTYQEQLGGLQPSNASLVHDNLAALEAFLLTYNMQEPDSSTASDAQRQVFYQGKDLYGKLWRADELEKKMNDEMDKQGQVNAPAKVLGPSNMAPWNLAFVAPEAQFIWGVEGGNINMDTGTSLFTLTKTVSLGSPDLFDLIIFADDHCDVFVNGGFMGSAIYPPILFPDDASAAVTIHLGAQHSGDLNLALRCSNSLYRGCAGVVAALKDSSGATRAVTDGSWRVSTAGQQQISVSADSINSMPAAVNLGGIDLWEDATFADGDAQWIWSFGYDHSTPAPADVITTFYSVWNAPSGSGSVSAQLYVAADDAADAFVNGAFVGSIVGGYSPAFMSDSPPDYLPVTLQEGANTIAIRCTNAPQVADENPAGLLASLRVGDQWVLRTGDGSWHYGTTKALDPPV